MICKLKTAKKVSRTDKDRWTMRPARTVVWEGLRSIQAYQVGTLCNVNMEYLREIGNIHRHTGLGRKVDLVSKNLENIGTFHNDFVSASFYVYLPLLSK